MVVVGKKRCVAQPLPASPPGRCGCHPPLAWGCACPRSGNRPPMTSFDQASPAFRDQSSGPVAREPNGPIGRPRPTRASEARRASVRFGPSTDARAATTATQGTTASAAAAGPQPREGRAPPRRPPTTTLTAPRHAVFDDSTLAPPSPPRAPSYYVWPRRWTLHRRPRCCLRWTPPYEKVPWGTRIFASRRALCVHVPRHGRAQYSPRPLCPLFPAIPAASCAVPSRPAVFISHAGAHSLGKEKTIIAGERDVVFDEEQPVYVQPSRNEARALLCRAVTRAHAGQKSNHRPPHSVLFIAGTTATGWRRRIVPPMPARRRRLSCRLAR